MDTLFPEFFSSSMLEELSRCELSFFRTYIQRLASPGVKKSKHLIAGGAFAYGCEIVRKAYYNDKIDMFEAIELGKEAILAYESTGDVVKSNLRISQALERYFKKYPLNTEMTPVALANGEFAIEYEFSFDTGIPHPDFPKQNIKIQGKLDGIYYTKYKGNILDYYIVDEKTCSSIFKLPGSDEIDYVREEAEWKYRPQFLLYQYAARQLGLKPKSTHVYKIPLTEKAEAPFSLEIEYSETATTIFTTTLFNRIEELVEKYKYYKTANNAHWVAFYPNFGKGCTAWGRECKYGIACLTEDGEETLETQFEQLVYTDYAAPGIKLGLYKEQKQL